MFLNDLLKGNVSYRAEIRCGTQEYGQNV